MHLPSLLLLLLLLLPRSVSDCLEEPCAETVSYLDGERSYVLRGPLRSMKRFIPTRGFTALRTALH
jgi:hypothetical protein